MKLLQCIRRHNGRTHYFSSNSLIFFWKLWINRRNQRRNSENPVSIPAYMEVEVKKWQWQNAACYRYYYYYRHQVKQATTDYDKQTNNERDVQTDRQTDNTHTQTGHRSTTTSNVMFYRPSRWALTKMKNGKSDDEISLYVICTDAYE